MNTDLFETREPLEDHAPEIVIDWWQGVGQHDMPVFYRARVGGLTLTEEQLVRMIGAHWFQRLRDRAWRECSPWEAA